MRRFTLNYKNTLIAFRFVAFLLLSFLLLYKPSLQNEPFPVPLLPLLVYLFSNLVLLFVSDARLNQSLWQFALFLFDILIVSWLIYLSQGWSSDLYLIYFLVIFMSGIQMRIWHSFLIGTLACIIYSFFVLRSVPDIAFSTHILLRFPFFYLISFYTAYLAHSAKEQGRNLEKKYQEEMACVEQRVTLGRLAGRIASEMTNPLSVIIGFAQGVLKRSSGSDELCLPVESILREAGRCKEMVADLLSLWDDINPRIDLVELNTLIQSALKDLALPTSAITCALNLAPSLPAMMGDRMQIFRAMKNILKNSIEAMPSGGNLTISSRLSEIKPAQAGELAENNCDGKAIEICISDTGTGIPDEIKKRIFEPFFSTKEERVSGLGLSITSAIVRRHNGQICFESGRNQGTRFVLRFAVADQTQTKMFQSAL